MIRVMGAGAFGTALVVSLAKTGPVTLWCRDADHAREMRKSRVNERRLPGVDLPEEISIATGDLPATDVDATLLSVPTQKLRRFARRTGGFWNRAGRWWRVARGLSFRPVSGRRR